MVNSSDRFELINDLQPNTEYAFSTKVIKGRHQSKWSESVLSKTSGAAEENGTNWKSYACKWPFRVFSFRVVPALALFARGRSV